MVCGIARVWNAADGACELVLAGHTEAVWSVTALMEDDVNEEEEDEQ